MQAFYPILLALQAFKHALKRNPSRYYVGTNDPATSILKVMETSPRFGTSPYLYSGWRLYTEMIPSWPL
jgi:hypothetical protein